jgi:hypothetical protein
MATVYQVEPRSKSLTDWPQPEDGLSAAKPILGSPTAVPHAPAPADSSEDRFRCRSTHPAVLACREDDLCASEVARDPLDFPVAVAGRIRSTASIQLPGLLPGLPVAFNAPRFGLGERALGGWTELAPWSLSRRRLYWRCPRRHRLDSLSPGCEDVNSAAPVKAKSASSKICYKSLFSGMRTQGGRVLALMTRPEVMC